MYKEEMNIGGLTIEIIRKSNLKNLYIRVNPPEGDVTVSSPLKILNYLFSENCRRLLRFVTECWRKNAKVKENMYPGNLIICGGGLIVYRSSMRENSGAL